MTALCIDGGTREWRWNRSPQGLRLTSDPVPGESVPGWISRSCALNAVPDVASALARHGIHCPRIARLVAPRPCEAELLDSALGARPGTAAQLAARVAETTRPGTFCVNGVIVPAGHCERRLRRYSPASLRRSAHHRAAWLLRTMPMCPEAWQLLQSRCPACGRELGWTRAEGILHCEWCRENGDPVVDLRDCQGETAPVTDDEAMSWVCGLLAFDHGQREAACAVLPNDLCCLDASGLYRLTMAMHRLATSIDDGTSPPKPLRMHASSWTCGDLERAARLLLDWPTSITRLADAARCRATSRPGAAGIVKELGPLLEASRYRFLPVAAKALFKQAVARELEGSAKGPYGIPRFGRVPQHPGFVTSGKAAAEMSVSRRMVGRLSRAAQAETIVFQGRSRARCKLAVRSMRRMSDRLADVESGPDLARKLGIPVESTSALAAIVGIEPASPEVCSVSGNRRLFSKRSVEGFLSNLDRGAKQQEIEAWPSVRSISAMFPYLPGGAGFALRAAAEGTLPCGRAGEADSLIDDLRVSPAAAFSVIRGGWVRHFGEESVPDQVDSAAACIMLCCSLATLYRMTAAGLLAPRSQHRPRYDAEKLRTFRARYCTVAEAAMLLGVAPVTAWRIFGSIERAVSCRLPGRGTLLDRPVVTALAGGAGRCAPVAGAVM